MMEVDYNCKFNFKRFLPFFEKSIKNGCGLFFQEQFTLHLPLVGSKTIVHDWGYLSVSNFSSFSIENHPDPHDIAL